MNSYIGQKKILQNRESQILKNSLRAQGHCHEEAQLKFWRYDFKIQVDWPDFKIGN